MEIKASEIPAWFTAELLKAGGAMHLTAKPQALRDHYERISAKLFSGITYGKDRKPLHITPYCFRHAVATDLRQSDDVDGSVTAAFLGHRSAKTQTKYGKGKGGKRKVMPQLAVVIDSVQASHSVKPKKSLWSNSTFKSKPLERSSNN